MIFKYGDTVWVVRGTHYGKSGKVRGFRKSAMFNDDQVFVVFGPSTSHYYLPEDLEHVCV